MQQAENPFACLSFVKPREMPDGRGYDFWCPEPVEITAARYLGKRYAFQYIQFETESMFAGQGAILGFIVRDMMAKGDAGDVARGFVYTLAEALAQAGKDPDFADWIDDQLEA